MGNTQLSRVGAMAFKNLNLMRLSLAVLALATLVAASCNEPTPSDYYTVEACVGAVILLCIGVLELFYGYRLFRILILLVGFVVFFFFSYTILASNWATEWYWITLVSACIGVVGALITVFFWLVALFLVGAICAFLLAGFVLFGVVFYYWSTGEWAVWVSYAIMIIMGILGGLVALKYRKLVIVLGTAILGAYLCTVSLDYLTYFDNGSFWRITEGMASGEVPACIPGFFWLFLGLWIVLSAVGTAVQFRVTGKGNHHDPKSENTTLIVAV